MTDETKALVERLLVERLRSGWNGWVEPAASSAADLIETQAREIERLREALKRSGEGWENAIELGLIPERHRNTAQILAEKARAALAGDSNDQ